MVVTFEPPWFAIRRRLPSKFEPPIRRYIRGRPVSNAPRTGSLLVIFLTVFVDLLGFGMVLPLLPLYANQFRTDDSGWMLGGLMASFSVMQFLCSPLWGRLSDRIGRRPVLMIGLAGSVVFYALFGVASIMESYWMLLLTRIGAGISGATISTAQAYIADSTSLETRPKGMALIGMAFGMGFTFGPLLGAFAVGPELDVATSAMKVDQAVQQSTPLEGEISIARDEQTPGSQLENPGPWPGFVASLLSACALFMAIFWLPESRQPGGHKASRKVFDFESFFTAIATPSIGPLLLTVFVCVFSFAQYEVTLSLLIKETFDFSFRQVCFTFASIGLTLAIIQGGLVRRIAGRVSESVMASTGAVIQAAGFGLAIVGVRQESVGLLFVAMPVVVLGFSLMQPNLNSLLSRRSSPARQGMILGVGQSVSSLARIVGSLVGIPLLRYQVDSPYYLAAGLMLMGSVLVVIAGRRGQDFDTSGSG